MNVFDKVYQQLIDGSELTLRELSERTGHSVSGIIGATARFQRRSPFCSIGSGITRKWLIVNYDQWPRTLRFLNYTEVRNIVRFNFGSQATMVESSQLEPNMPYKIMSLPRGETRMATGTRNQHDGWVWHGGASYGPAVVVKEN